MHTNSHFLWTICLACYAVSYNSHSRD